MTGFEFLEPRSVEETCQLLSEYREEAKLFAGGIALVKLLKKRLIHPSCLVNIKGIRELQFIRENRDGLKIGALTTLTEIEKSPLMRERFSALAAMVRTIASVQIRNVGTLAGNLCFADPASDPAPLLIALGARLKVRSSEGERIVPLEGFFTDFYETILRQDEIVEEIHVPPLPKNSGAIYVKHTMRVAFDLAIVGVAVWLGLNSKSGVCEDISIVLGGVASTPIRVKKAEEALKGKAIDDSVMMKAAMAVAEEADPIHDVRASAQYRKELIEVLLGRAIQGALTRAEGGPAS